MNDKFKKELDKMIFQTTGPLFRDMITRSEAKDMALEIANWTFEWCQGKIAEVEIKVQQYDISNQEYHKENEALKKELNHEKNHKAYIEEGRDIYKMNYSKLLKEAEALVETLEHLDKFPDKKPGQAAALALTRWKKFRG